MSILLINLYLSFLKIGFFGFGGGYAMISLIQEELINHGWLGLEDFVNIIAIAEMTPGPIAINSGTFVGFKVSTLLGSLAATIGVITPSFILVLILAYFFKKIKDSNYVNSILLFLRPAVIGLITAAAFTIGKTSVIDLTGFIITSAVIFLMLKTSIHPILVIVLAGLSGMIIYA
ncbi:chromate transporter [Iocasia frigidifontis]|uniref:Chromate transporter n=1 Tax=Iocasia fonsfrigidae TaxID=2682810 RepID=A0A8A7KFY9_9FIRM|nr:chromate transporter [Iocasia fonsfrigidae]QTL98618.1 chromate transporter [Iocasia fonsfrigidae]